MNREKPTTKIQCLSTPNTCLHCLECLSDVLNESPEKGDVPTLKVHHDPCEKFGTNFTKAQKSFTISTIFEFLQFLQF